MGQYYTMMDGLKNLPKLYRMNNYTTCRLLIRNLRIEDLEEFHAYRSEPEVTRYQGFGTFTIQQAASFIMEQKDKVFGNPGEWVQYAIVNMQTQKLVGDCAIKLDENNR